MHSSSINNRPSLILGICFLLVFSLGSHKSALAGTIGELPKEVLAGPKQLKAGISRSEFGAALETIGINCLLETNAHPKCWVTDVRPGGIAFYKGLAKGDCILSLIKSGKGYEVAFERKGKNYKVYLEALAKPSIAIDLVAQKTKLESQTGVDLLKLQIDKSKLQTGVAKQGLQAAIAKKETDLKKIAQYQLELIIDRSGSMDWQDGTGDLSKFQWCEKQTTQLAKALEPYTLDLTVTVFNPDFETFRNVKVEKIHEIYEHYRPEGGTDLVDPLRARIDEYLRKRTSKSKPLLIAVITDGLPNMPENPDVVLDYLVKASQEMRNANEITVTFLQIGDTFEGQSFLLKLACNAVAAGAKYDFIDTRTFDQLKSSGLTSALIAAVNHETKRSLPASIFGEKQRYYLKHTVLPNAALEKLSNLNTQIKNSTDERQQLEKLILQAK